MKPPRPATSQCPHTPKLARGRCRPCYMRWYFRDGGRQIVSLERGRRIAAALRADALEVAVNAHAAQAQS